MSQGALHRPSRRSPWGVIGLVAAGAALVLGLLVAPPDAVQGQPQRLMYLHVPSAWTAFLAFGVVAVASIAVLLRAPGRPYDAVAVASAEIGVAMTALCLVEGSIWGHASWGVWWAWDPRLVSTALMFLVYLGYLALHALPGDPEHASRRAAKLGVVAFLVVPLVHFSVLWWRTLHQPPTVLAPDLAPPIAPVMFVALLVSLVAFTCGAVWYVQGRVRQLVDAASGSSRRIEPVAPDPTSPAAGAPETVTVPASRVPR